MRLPLSLGWRLGLSGALVAALASALLGAYLYGSFEQQLLRRDDVQLLGKLRQLRQLLGRSGTPELLREQADYVRDTMSGESNALIEIHAAPAQGGGLLLNINPQRLPLPGERPVDLVQEAGLQDIRHWTTPDGVPAAALNAWARLGPDRVEIRLARLYPERRALLADYRLRIVAASLAAGGLAAVLVLTVIWQGLAPLRRVRAQTAAIGPQSLGLRLHAADMPDELRPLVEGVNTMLARLEQGYAQLNQFAADLAHELRTPLATLTGQSQVMLSRPRTEAEYAGLLELQLQELERMGRLVDSLLFLARSEHQALAGALRRQPLSAAEELARQADYFSDLADERGLRLQCRGDAPLWAEPLMLRRALANLISNALRHARPGSVIELAARTEQSGGAAVAVLEVINEGEPLPPEVMSRLFDRFYRADPSRQGDAGGSGLGLAIVRAILALHGGSAEVRQPSAGQIAFVLRIPVAAAAPGDGGPPPSAGPADVGRHPE
ncbi:MAG: heavy metal sensor histidine kinase [Comamonadaceae bacterium]|nr:heavy metal sensor histidine kinase [Comamonadaceae bacterium]